MVDSFEIGDLVWAKMKSFPQWPSKICDPSEANLTTAKKGHHCVFFFGSKNYAWIPDDKIEPHSEAMWDKVPKKKMHGFQEAMDALKEELEKAPAKKPTFKPIASPVTPAPKNDAFDKLKKSKKVHVKRYSLDKKAKKRPAEVNGDQVGGNLFLYVGSTEAPFKKHSSITYFNSYTNSPFQSNLNHAERPATPPLDIEEKTETLLAKNIVPTTKKIGFLGLGALGSGIVKNLLNSGHNVTVWNRNKEKCIPFEKAGAKLAETPADVVEMCDLIFSCVADPHAAKVIFFETYGVLKGLECSSASSKGYIELSGIDHKTSEEIAKEVCIKGTKYLEAPISGSRSLAVEGQLLVLAAGDQELFHTCESCFSAFSKHSYYISSDFGTACKMNVILSLFKGTAMAALSEAITLVNSCSLPTDIFLQSLDFGHISKMLEEKGHAMVKGDYKRDITLNHQQKDLSLALELASSLNQPLGVGTSVNELYKRAKQRLFGEFDVSALIEGAKLKTESQF